MYSIQTKQLSKRYLIGHQRKDQYATFRETLMHKARAATQRLLHPLSPNPEIVRTEDLWALRDINLDIKQGDRVGIIGRNGAGKSTLLKVLSRITDPTEGSFTIEGRVASLLEIGTGFHPELSGRENIYLNGAIHGMGREEIKKKFDQIVDFSEVEQFLDTPVKRFSSGMYVRLAFAVAAHLDPEVLIVDEVLAVGDAQFQKKCLGKMEEAGTEGRTVLFVSHQMGSIARLCETAVLLESGKIKNQGPVSDVIASYLGGMTEHHSEFLATGSNRSIAIRIESAELQNIRGGKQPQFRHDESACIAITCNVNQKVGGAEVRLTLRDSHRIIFTTDTQLLDGQDKKSGKIQATVMLPAGLLRPGSYWISLATYLPNAEIYDSVVDALGINIIDGGSKYAASEGVDYGCVFVDCDWSVKRL